MWKDTIRKYWLANVHNLPAAFLTMNRFDECSSTKLERVRLGSEINLRSHICYHCDALPYNLKVEKTRHCPFLFRISRLTLQRLTFQAMLPLTCWWRSVMGCPGFFLAHRKRRLTYCPGHKDEACEGQNSSEVRWIENQFRYGPGAQIATGRLPATKVCLEKVRAGL